MTDPALPAASPASMRVTLLVMTLDEIDGMKAVMPKIEAGWVDQIIVVDGGSTDGTAEWARARGYEVYVQKKRGIRHAYTEAMARVRGDVVLTFSPDGNCRPEDIPVILAAMGQGYDMVIGSRYLGGMKSEDDDRLTAFGNRLFTGTVNVLHGGRYTDAMTIFRAYRKDLVTTLGLDDDAAYRLPERLFHTVVSWEPLLSVRAARYRLKVAEVPAPEPPRIGGTRKLQIWRWGAAYYFQFWAELLTRPRRRAGTGSSAPS